MSVKIETALDPRRVAEVTNDVVVGFDIGSRTGKAVLLKDGLIFSAIAPTAVFTQQTVDKLLSILEEDAKIKLSDIDFAIGTGYGRVAFDLKDTRKKIVTEITCHAMGAYYLNSDIQSIVDIGGQDAKAIRVDPRNGHVVDFIMNDKCAAGTGRFLEKVAELLGLTTEELGVEALKATEPSDISSQCVVFAESEVISLSAKSEPPTNIAAGIHFANARRIKNLFNRIGLVPEIMFSGGVAHNVGMKKAVEQVLGHKFIEVNYDAIFTGALGAAILAQQTLISSKLDMAINI
ncbi:MAG: acyl-CoA dehydratase activase [Deltaproteobacteria bacterium]|jgi:predicted CoA-substrate-specific enzyme activase|nr:acyl-CoA dehydratase activase [Deltaproteobacteria bacterium]